MKPITQENSKLGFIGIGYMGLPVARRLLGAGFQLIAYDREPNKAAELIQYGGKIAQSILQLSANCNVLLTCLPSDQVVLDVYRSADGVFANATPGLRVIELSTVNPETSQQVARLGSAHGIDVLDVTMSGSTPVAEKGLLTLFGGGNKEFFDDAESIFRAIGFATKSKILSGDFAPTTSTSTKCIGRIWPFRSKKPPRLCNPSLRKA